jgi:uncharacterized Ntn-hydrolase superfamily protein
MTFSIVAFCERSGKLGACQTTGTPAVGARCVQIVPGRAAILVQAAIDYKLVRQAAALAESGLEPEAILRQLEAADPKIDYRQVAIVGPGGVAMRSGSKAHAWAGMKQDRNFVAAGNGVVGARVVEAMAEAFAGSASEELEERLVRAVEAGRDAGGQPTGQNSAVLTICTTEPFPIVDLRVDMHDEPVGELRRIFDWYKPLIPYYVRRNADPTMPIWRDYLKSRSLPLKPSAAPVR